MGQAGWSIHITKVDWPLRATEQPRYTQVQPRHDVSPLSVGGQTSQVSPSCATFFLCFSPADLDLLFHEDVAVAEEADPSVFTGGVRTLDLILSVDTVLAQVAAEVTSE